MRSYPSNSPEAVTRLLSLAALADGHISQVELDALERAGSELPDGLTGERLQGVLQALCQDLLGSLRLSWSDVVALDAQTLAALFDEIKDPALRRQALLHCLRVAQADQHLHEAESKMLLSAVTNWGLLEDLHPIALPKWPVAQPRAELAA